MNLTFCQPSDTKTVSAFESPVFLHVLVRCARDLAHWGRLFETPFFRYVSVRYGRLKDIVLVYHRFLPSSFPCAMFQIVLSWFLYISALPELQFRLVMIQKSSYESSPTNMNEEASRPAHHRVTDTGGTGYPRYRVTSL